MSDLTGTAVPTVTITPESPAPVAVVPKPAESSAEPSWLPERLERERKSFLKKAGFESIEDAQAAATALKAQKDAEKTAAEKAAETLLRATTAENNATALRSAVSEFAKLQLQSLTIEQKAAVDAIAGEDPAAQLKAINALKPTWAQPAAATQTAAPVTADTAPPANAPPAVSAGATNHRAQYETLKKTNPFAAAAYAIEHSNSIYGNGT